MTGHCLGCGVEFPPDGGSGVFGYCLACRESQPMRITSPEVERDIGYRVYGPARLNRPHRLARALSWLGMHRIGRWVEDRLPRERIEVSRLIVPLQDPDGGRRGD